jgi:CRP/FNR family transcriptional regulator, cyclic AMP receptor protein
MPISINLFRNAKEVRSVAAGEKIFSKGDSADFMYVITEGSVDVLYSEHLINTLEAGDILGEMGLLEKSDRSADAVAHTDCKLVPVNEQYFTYMVQQTPFFALQVMRIMSSRMRQMIEDHHQAE